MTSPLKGTIYGEALCMCGHPRHLHAHGSDRCAACSACLMFEARTAHPYREAELSPLHPDFTDPRDLEQSRFAELDGRTRLWMDFYKRALDTLVAKEASGIIQTPSTEDTQLYAEIVAARAEAIANAAFARWIPHGAAANTTANTILQEVAALRVAIERKKANP